MHSLIETEELQARLGEPELRIIDCRFQLGDPVYGPERYAAGHIPGAVYAHLDTDLSSPIIPGKTGRHPLPDPERLAARLRAWGVSRDSEVVAYDDGNAAYAGRVWWLLRWLGHTRVRVLNGGWTRWCALGGRQSQTVPRPAPGDFTGTPDWTRVVGAEDVLAHLGDAGRVLLDARAAPRFRGEVEPIDPVAGHIPGALCAEFSENLAPDGRFKESAALGARFAGFDVNNREVVCYCGSGVTACNNILAATLAGLPEPKLYAGSWSEWITDPARPIARA